MSVLIRLRGLKRVFRNGAEDVEILKGLTLDIHSGEMVAIVGQSGSGKSTLMNILGCLDRPSAGVYEINGRDVSQLSDEEQTTFRREYIGFIFQRYHLLGNLTAWENVVIPAIYSGEAANKCYQRAKLLLERLGLGERINFKPHQLSGGQQQRVSIARALMNGGQIIFADEPTGALDSRSGEEVMTILRELHAEGHTIILVTHDRNIATHAERIIEIKDGEIISDSKNFPTREYLTKPIKIIKHNPYTGIWGRIHSSLMTAWRSIWGHKLRAFLTMLGIIIGIASVVSMVALGQGSQKKVLEQISDLGSNTIEIFAGKFGDRRAFRIRTLIPADAKVLAQQEFIDSATPIVNSSPTLRYGNQALNSNLTGVGEQYFQVQNIPIVQGRAFAEMDINNYAAVAILDQIGAKNLFGEENPLGKVVLLKNVPVKIIGIADTAKQNRMAGSNNINIFMPYTAAMNRLLGRTNVSSILLRINDKFDTTITEDAITRILTRRHGAEDFSLFNTDSIRKAIQETTQTLSLLISAIAAIALVVGGIGVMNIMLVSVVERTQEIGIRRAIGARQNDVLMQFLIESLVLCLLGGVLGVMLSYGLGFLASQVNSEFELIYSTSSIVLACICSSGIGLLFGYLPARNAAHLSPVEALASE